MNAEPVRRVVITGIGVICPLGNTTASLEEALRAGTSGVRELTRLPGAALPSPFGAECRSFTGQIDDFGPLDKEMKKTIRKGLKVMCREIQMGVAAAQWALNHAGLTPGTFDPDRVGVLFGCDYLMTMPEEFIDAVKVCTDSEQHFQFSEWGERGLAKTDPLWLLKFLPNMPASHVAIYNDLRGPNNSLTLREASSNAALAEAYLTISRGHADGMLTGATGSRLHPMKSVQICLNEEIATGNDPALLCRPFDLHRNGSVLGEGAAVLMLEELGAAERRGANILAEVVGYGSSTVASAAGTGDIAHAVENVLRQALATSRWSIDDVDHIHAHGLGTRNSDAGEAAAVAKVFHGRRQKLPIMAAKSSFGNLGAAGGMVETVVSLLALAAGKLFPVPSYTTPDPDCAVTPVTDHATGAGRRFINVNVTPQGQAAAIAIQAVA
jgi:3-oxoacyl-[acyl-carrier-protein] synthase II